MIISNIIFLAERIIYYIRIQNYAESRLILFELLKKIEEADDLADELLNIDSTLYRIMQSMTAALEANDMILLSDILDDAFIPELKGFIHHMDSIENSIYRIESTSSGFPTLFCKESNKYLHSNSNPMEEARVLADQIYKPEYDEYAVWGCGLGYHIYQLFETAKRAINIIVYDWNSSVFELASKTGFTNLIPKERIRYVTDVTGKEFVDRISKGNIGIFIHFPSVLSIHNKQLREAFQSFFSDWNSTVQLERDLEINFRNNQKRISNCVDDIEEEFKNKEVVLVAGGPSVDECIEWLRAVKGHRTIIVVTRVLKKMIDLGIIPDYAVSLEANKAGYEQLHGLDDISVPIIIDSTAYWENAASYKGQKYIAYQKGYKAAEQYAEQNKKRLYETGGSVITLAMDILLQFKVSKIFLVGADMAYPEGVTHALNTDHRQILDTDNMELVESVTGGMVPTDLSLNKFRKWIERKLLEHPEVEVYNLSNKGAYIKGTKPYTHVMDWVDK